MRQVEQRVHSLLPPAFFSKYSAHVVLRYGMEKEVLVYPGAEQTLLAQEIQSFRRSLGVTPRRIDGARSRVFGSGVSR